MGLYVIIFLAVLFSALLGFYFFGKHKARGKVYKNAAAMQKKREIAAKRAARTLPDIIKQLFHGKF